MLFRSNELKNKVREYRKALEEEEKQRNRLASKNLDYAYLEQLVKRCEQNKDLVIEVTTADGSYITIKTDRNPTRLRSETLFDAAEEILL